MRLANSRQWLVVLAALVIGASVVGVAAYTASARARLVRSDPDAVTGDAALMALALPSGRAAYGARCAACHGEAGKGDRSQGVPDLTDADWLYGSGRVSDIQRIVDTGIRSGLKTSWNLASMPAYASPAPSPTEKIAPLTPPDVRDVAEFLVWIEHRPADTASAARGREIYEGRGGCYDCHGADAHGDPGIGAPNLTDTIWLYGDGSRASIEVSIERGRHGVCPGGARQLSAFQSRAVALYVYSLSHKSKPGAAGST